MFGLFKKKPKPELVLGHKSRHQGLPAPLGLSDKASVVVDPLLGKLMPGFVLELPTDSSALMVDAQGEIDMGDVHLHRFYTKEDYWIQVKQVASAEEYDSIDEIILFGFGDVLNPTTQHECDKYMALIGKKTYQYADVEYVRVFGDDDSEYAGCPAFVESVYPEMDDKYTTNHQIMLYRRNVEGADRPELLLVAVETDSENNVSIVHSVGIQVYQSELTIT
jgi:hypothetical protein